MACRDRLGRRLEVGEGLDSVDLCGDDERGDAAPVASAFLVPGEECVLPCQGDRADQVHHGIGADLDAAALQEGLQPVPLAVDVGAFLAEAGLGGDPATLELQPFAELGHQRRRAYLSR